MFLLLRFAPQHVCFEVGGSNHFQFDLVFRFHTTKRDSPHSHAFFRSIRSGCIPVVSSATLPIWSPILKHTLDMSEYTIMLDEQELIQNTQDMLLKLQDLDEEYIETKIKNLQFAQRVWFQDHPESLFVRSYLYEALHASEVDDSLSPYGVRKWR